MQNANATTPLILASASPRRAEILAHMGIPYEIVPSTVDESRISADHPRTFAIRAAFAKAHEVASRVSEGRWVLGADTVVTRRMLLYGKPTSEEHARRILAELSGQSHQVITGIALVRAGTLESHLHGESTTVVFDALDPGRIDAYVATGEPMDKAGAYGIQGGGGALISAIDGCYFNVVGLPCRALAGLLQEAGIEIEARVPEPPGRWRGRG